MLTSLFVVYIFTTGGSAAALPDCSKTLLDYIYDFIESIAYALLLCYSFLLRP